MLATLCPDKLKFVAVYLLHFLRQNLIFILFPDTNWYIIVLRFDNCSIVESNHHSIHFFININHVDI